MMIDEQDAAGRSVVETRTLKCEEQKGCDALLPEKNKLEQIYRVRQTQ